MQRALVFDDSKLPRRARVKLWLRRAGYASLAALARDMGVHHTYPGKMLVSGKERVTPEWREWLLKRGCPEELV
ncbi:MAG: XRE family transcriptional regulator [Humidesulfovibrio sp.]|nr:XRE family transcriptional regulator [Humidesulfovibrio sp.]